MKCDECGQCGQQDETVVVREPFTEIEGEPTPLCQDCWHSYAQQMQIEQAERIEHE